MSTTPDAFRTDSNGKLSVCQASEFVPGDASRQCVRPSNHPGPHAFPVAREHVACQADLAAVRADLDSSTRALERLTKAHEAARKELGDARKGEAVLRECLRNLLASAVHEAMEGDGVSEEMEPHVKAAQKALAGEIPAGAT